MSGVDEQVDPELCTGNSALKLRVCHTLSHVGVCSSIKMLCCFGFFLVKTLCYKSHTDTAKPGLYKSLCMVGGFFVQYFTVAAGRSTLSEKSAYVVFICSTLVEVNCLIDEQEDSNCVKFVTFHVLDKKYSDDSKLDSMVSCQHWCLFPLPSSYLKLKWSLFYSLEWKPDPACARVSWRQEKKMACPIAYDGVPFVFTGRKGFKLPSGVRPEQEEARVYCSTKEGSSISTSFWSSYGKLYCLCVLRSPILKHA